MTEITMTLDPNSIKAAIDKLKAYDKKMKSNLATAVEALAGDGVRVAEPLYENVQALVTRENEPGVVRPIPLNFLQGQYRNVRVTQEIEGSGNSNSKLNKMIRYVVARGSGVGFAEFGAGVTSDYNAPFAKNAPFPVYDGSWSEQDKQQYTRYGKWWFSSLTYYGIVPSRALYEAYKEMSRLALPRVKAAFRRGNRL